VNKRTADLALFSVAGGLLLWGASKARKDPDPTNKASSLAMVGGAGLALFGAFRVSPRLGLGLTAGLVGVGAVSKYRMNHGQMPLTMPGMTFSTDKPVLDADTRAAVATALDKETDPAILGEFASRLSAAGHKQAAASIAKKAEGLSKVAVGLSPSAVMAAQGMLRDLGYDVELDGMFGPKTAEAVKKFQSLHDLDIDGQLGKATMAALAAATTKR
jgi:hypothetical protein